MIVLFKNLLLPASKQSLKTRKERGSYGDISSEILTDQQRRQKIVRLTFNHLGFLKENRAPGLVAAGAVAPFGR